MIHDDMQQPAPVPVRLLVQQELEFALERMKYANERWAELNSTHRLHELGATVSHLHRATDGIVGLYDGIHKDLHNELEALLGRTFKDPTDRPADSNHQG